MIGKHSRIKLQPMDEKQNHNPDNLRYSFGLYGGEERELNELRSGSGTRKKFLAGCAAIVVFAILSFGAVEFVKSSRSGDISEEPGGTRDLIADHRFALDNCWTALDPVVAERNCTRVLEHLGPGAETGAFETLSPADQSTILFVHILRGTARLHLSDFEGVHEDVSAVSQVDELENDVSMLLGTAAFLQENFEEAQAHLSNVRPDPENPYNFLHSRSLLARANHELGAYQQAIEATIASLGFLESLPGGFPNKPDEESYLLSLQAHALLRTGNLASARAASDASLRTGMLNDDALLTAAQLDVAEGIYDSAAGKLRSLQSSQTGYDWPATLYLGWLALLTHETSADLARTRELLDSLDIATLPMMAGDSLMIERTELEAAYSVAMGDLEDAIARFAVLSEDNAGYLRSLSNYFIRHGLSDAPVSSIGEVEALLTACAPEGCIPRQIEWCGSNNDLPCRDLIFRLPDRH